LAKGAASGVPADAVLGVRFAGYCVLCDRIVERVSDGSCPQGHPAEAVTGRIVLIDDAPVPALPRFNWAAFLLPFIWGPAHEEWAAALFLPIWLFMDSIISVANKGGIPTTVGGVIVVVLTLTFQAYYAKRANGVAYRRVIDTQSVEEYARRERIWAIASAPVALLLVVWMVWFHIVVAPTLPQQ
jgi:hypothetical protein